MILINFQTPKTKEEYRDIQKKEYQEILKKAMKTRKKRNYFNLDQKMKKKNN